ncbi:glycosyltransferase involved in cell wall biosynthesis/2-polyprenyl-3-methyl-5-hydroxy-6-metoxy-1,4-benzoquinol methylase [Undibacterium sp. GrIS 1.8]|uniref:glycoside hydrolase family 99-like domain-containing protein n=1 Tax=unclassified Undibacterium TaxID=2630295 RepID=UPI0033918F80
MENHTKYSRDVIPDIEESLSKIVEKISTNSVVLDVGCSSGMLGRYLVMQKECVVDGVDLDGDAINICHPVYRKVAIKNLENDDLLNSFAAESYDYIVVADVIEHLNQPAKLLRQLRILIKPHGTILFSVPNITHIAASLELLAGKFSYAQNGLLDNTHLRFYSYKSLQAKLAESGIYLWELDTVQRNLTDTEYGDGQVKLFPSAWLDAIITSRPDSLVYQWIFHTKIYPSLEPVNDIARYQKKLISPIFTTALYFSRAPSGGFNEANKLPGYKHEVTVNESIVEFYFQNQSNEPLSQIRIDPASDMKSIWIKQAHIINLNKEILWRWSSNDADIELVNAYWTGVSPDQGRILCSENDDPQWYPKIPLGILREVKAGDQFSMTICDNGATIDAQIEAAWNKQKKITQKIIIDQTEAALKQNTHIQALEEELSKRTKISEELTKISEELRTQLTEKEVILQRILDSRSWIITKPFRYINRKLKIGILGALQTIIFDVFSFFWRIFPLPRKWKGMLKSALISSFPSLFGRYRHWVNSDPVHAGLANYASLLISAELTDGANDIATYVPLLEAEPLQKKQVKLICFYLPQFHAIPENNAWWGEGFTEWANVKPAQSQFEGHYQPHVPGELGYYDLLDRSVQRRQIELAKLYGVEGFCFYFYWFGGTRLLEKPIENYLNDRSLDLPFCLCWANENWSRRWDGLDQEMLIQQQHSPEDDIAFIEHVARYMSDARYIRIDGKPLLIVYRPGLLPSPKETVARWRVWCKENDIGEIYLAYTQSFEVEDPTVYDFDAAIEFPPNNSSPPDITHTVQLLNNDFSGTVYDSRIFLSRSEAYKQTDYTLFRGVCPSWDNTARRKNNATVFQHSTPAQYQRWLENAIRNTLRYQSKQDERLIFINAWNEWAEGAHLEPDQRYGYAYLQATRDAITKTTSSQSKAILIVTHDCHPHGAQFLILEIARQLKESGFLIAILALDGGSLFEEFNKISPTFNAKKQPPKVVHDFLRKLNACGTIDAITSTVICGSILPLLKSTGFQVLSLIHEMPGIIREMKQDENARIIAHLADKVVFPASIVHTLFCEIAPVSTEKVLIQPQGVLRKNPYKDNKSEAHREICLKHSLPENSQIVLSIGFMDMRKGADFFIDIANNIIHTLPNVVFIWVGHAEISFEQKLKAKVKQLDLSDKIIFTGFVRDPMAYYAAASVYALTSREDPFPNVVLESAEVSVPVVAFKGASGTEEFILEQGGRIANHIDFDTSDFCRQVNALLDRDHKTQSRGGPSLRQYAIDLVHHLNGLPRVSVVVPNFNYAQYLKMRLDSIVNQQFPIYELIVLDDASTDRSEQVIEGYLNKCKFDNLLVKNELNSGSVFRQWEKGISLSKGDLVWIAEADDLAEPEFLESLTSAFTDSSVVMAFSQSKQIDEEGRVLANNYLDYTRDISSKWEKSYQTDGKVEIAEALSIKNTIPNVSGAVFKRESLRKVFDEIDGDLYDYTVAGDWLLYLKILLNGKVYFEHRSLNTHRRHQRSVTTSLNVTRHLEEVCNLQKIARSLVEPSNVALVKAERYREYLHRYFDIPMSKSISNQ